VESYIQKRSHQNLYVIVCGREEKEKQGRLEDGERTIEGAVLVEN
jgi:hypothetical protein